MTTASRMGLWLGAAALVGAGALAMTGSPQHADAPVTPAAVAEVTAEAAPVAALPALPAPQAKAKRTPATVVQAKQVSEAPVAASPAPEHSAGMTVAIDPETGLIGASPAEAALKADAGFQADLPVIRMPDGSLMMELDDRFDMYSTVTMGPDGKPRFGCGPKPHPAHKNCAHPALPVE